MSSRLTGAAAERASRHASHAWTCPCGKTVRGNGGKSSHQRACEVWQGQRLDRYERAIAEIDAGTWGARMSPDLVADFRTQYARERDRLRERLGLPSVAEAASTKSQCPDGGICHHSCIKGCFRVACCGPLSGVYPDDEWPADVRAAGQDADGVL